MSEAQIKRGLVKARDYTGFFNLPAFRELCRSVPQDYGLPDVYSAYREACLAPEPKPRHDWSHPAVYQAGVKTGWYELATMPESQTFKRFENFYTELCRRVMEGEDIHGPIVEALPDSISVPMTTEERIVEFNKLKASLGF